MFEISLCIVVLIHCRILDACLDKVQYTQITLLEKTFEQIVGVKDLHNGVASMHAEVPSQYMAFSPSLMHAWKADWSTIILLQILLIIP